MRTVLEHNAGPLAPVLQWVNPKFGPLRNLHGVRQAYPEPDWWVYRSEIGRSLGSYFTGDKVTAMGTSIDGSEALMRVLGEAVERYVCFNSFRSQNSKRMLVGENPILQSLPKCANFEPCTDIFKQLPPHLTLTHVEMRRLFGGGTEWIPASYVHMDFKPPEGEPLTYRPISTGMAFHSTLAEAIWSGLCEVVERDAVMLAWWNRLPVQKIAFDEQRAPAPLAERLQRLNACGLKVHLFDVTTDFRVPSVFCILEGKQFPFYIASAAVDGDPLRCCTKAIDEAITIRYAQTNFGHSECIQDFNDFSWLHSLEHIADLYANWKDSPAIEALTLEPPLKTWEDFCNEEFWKIPQSMEELEQLALLMDSMGLTVLWSDLTTDDIREFGRCVRIVVPEMLPLSVDFSVRWLGSCRLQKFRKKQGTTIDDFNRYPQPLA